MTFMFSPFSKLVFKLIRNFFILCEVISLLSKSVKLKIFTLSILQFSSKFINMLVMFLPLKVFLLVSNSTNVGTLSFIENIFGRKGYIGILLLFTVFLYLLNVLLQIKYGNLINLQKTKVELDNYFYGNKKFSQELILRLYRPCYLASGSFIMIVIASIVLFFISIEFAFIYITIFYIYLAFVEYFVFTDNKFNLLKRVNLSENQLLKIFSSVFYLVLFFSTFIIFNYRDLPVSSAILILLLSRVANASIKDFIFNQHRVVSQYFTGDSIAYHQNHKSNE